jgi:hypothetical protein
VVPAGPPEAVRVTLPPRHKTALAGEAETEKLFGQETTARQPAALLLPFEVKRRRRLSPPGLMGLPLLGRELPLKLPTEEEPDELICHRLRRSMFVSVVNCVNWILTPQLLGEISRRESLALFL